MGTSSAAVSTRAAARLDRSCSLGYFMLTLLIRLKMNMYRRPRLGFKESAEMEWTPL